MVEMKQYMRKSLNDVPKLKIFEFSNYASQFDNVIKFTIGEPDFNTPEYIKDAAIKSIKNNRTHYAPQRGTAGLLKAVANFLAQNYDLHYNPQTEILITRWIIE